MTLFALYWSGLAQAADGFAVQLHDNFGPVCDDGGNCLIGHKPIINIIANVQVAPHLDVTGFTVTSPYWAEGYVGVNWTPVDWITVGASAGLEQSATLWRLASFTWLGNDRLAWLLVTEWGGGGGWYTTTATATFDPLTIGIFSEQFQGTGPYARFATGPALGFWVAVTFSGLQLGSPLDPDGPLDLTWPDGGVVAVVFKPAGLKND